MNNLPDLAENKAEIDGKVVLVRAGLNAPLEDGKLADDFRLEALLPTLNVLTESAKTVIVCGHISGNDKNTARLAAEWLSQYFSVDFVGDYDNGAAQQAIDQSTADLVVFENLRQYPGEKANDETFAKMLASYADVYVNEAFPAAHRAHASVVGVPKFLPSFAGLQFQKEVEVLSHVLDPDRPFTFVLGGAKFSTKLPLVEKFAKKADNLFVGGALLNAYLQAAGSSVGSSRVPKKSFSLVAHEGDVVHLPETVVVEHESGVSETVSVAEIEPTDTIVDLSADSVDRMKNALENSTLAVWNGPLGWYEKGYTEATDQLAQMLTEAEAETILGGGDTATVVLDDINPADFDFVSTAGGAMIQFLADESLPAIEALRN